MCSADAQVASAEEALQAGVQMVAGLQAEHKVASPFRGARAD